MAETDYTDYDDFDAMWGTTPSEAPTSSEPVPDGKYAAEIVSVKMGAWKDGSPRMEWEFRVIGGDCDGRKTWMNDGLDPKKLGKTKGHLELMGIIEPNFSGCVRRLPELAGRAVNIAVSTYNDRSYTFLNGVPDSAPAPATTPAQATISGTTAAPAIPF
jgi:hypothetical protein